MRIDKTQSCIRKVKWYMMLKQERNNSFIWHQNLEPKDINGPISLLIKTQFFFLNLSEQMGQFGLIRRTGNGPFWAELWGKRKGWWDLRVIFGDWNVRFLFRKLLTSVRWVIVQVRLGFDINIDVFLWG